MAKKILIVDDEKDIRISVKMLLEDSNYYVKMASNAKAGLLALKKEKFDLVLLDILMPKMSGIEMLEKVREDKKLKNQKVAFMTVVLLRQKDKKIISKLKPIDYFEKPIQPTNFIKRIKKILK